MSSLIVCERLRVVVKVSYQERSFLIFAHALALLGILQSGFYLLLPCLVFSVAYYLRCWSQHQRVQSLQLQDECCWLENQQDVRQQYQLGKRHFISDFLVVVQLREQQGWLKRSRYVAIFSDAVDVDTFRQLRVVLSLNQRLAPANSVASE